MALSKPLCLPSSALSPFSLAVDGICGRVVHAYAWICLFTVALQRQEGVVKVGKGIQSKWTMNFWSLFSYHIRPLPNPLCTDVSVFFSTSPSCESWPVLCHPVHQKHSPETFLIWRLYHKEMVKLHMTLPSICPHPFLCFLFLNCFNIVWLISWRMRMKGGKKPIHP